MGARLTNEERHNRSLRELAPAIGDAQARSAGEDYDQLLFAQVVVLRIGRLAWGDVPETETEALSADLATDARAATLEARVLASLIELGIVEVRHWE